MNQENMQPQALRTVIAIAATDLRLAVELMLSEDPDLIFVGAVSSADGLRGLVEQTHPDLIILQGETEQFAEADLCPGLKRVEDPPKIVFLGSDLERKQAALDAGADAYVLIGDSPDRLQEAIWSEPEAVDTGRIVSEAQEEE